MDGLGVLILPGEGDLEELLPPEVVAAYALLAQSLLDLGLGGDPGVVDARDPEHVEALHPLVAGGDVVGHGVHYVA